MTDIAQTSYEPSTAERLPLVFATEGFMRPDGSMNRRLGRKVMSAATHMQQHPESIDAVVCTPRRFMWGKILHLTLPSDHLERTVEDFGGFDPFIDHAVTKGAHRLDPSFISAFVHKS